MLNREVVLISAGLGTLLADKGKALTVRNDSALDFMVKSCPLTGLVTTDGSPPTADAVVDYLTYRGEEEDHCQATDLVVDKAAESVAQLLAFSRNVVMPDIRDIYAKIEAGMESARFSVRSPFNIVPQITPRLYKNPLVSEMLDRYSEVAAAEVPLLNLPPLTLEQIEEAIRTGNAEFDGEVKELLKDYPNALPLLGEVWAGSMSLGFVDPSYVIVLHLLAKGLLDNPPAGTAIPLADYNQKVAQLVEQTGRMARVTIEIAARRSSYNQLYAVSGGEAQPVDTRNIYVNNDVYLSFMEKGLTPEALIGNEILGRIYKAEELLDEGTRKEVELVYSREMQLRDAKSKVDDFNIARDVIERVLSNEINNRDTLLVVPEVLHLRLHDKMATLQFDDMKQLPILVRDLVCWIFYANTDAHRYICLFDQVGGEQPELDDRTVGLVALARYVFSWTADQILVQ